MRSLKPRPLMFGLLLWGIILIGIGLRFFQLGHESLWLDETATGLRVQMSWSTMFDVLINMKGNPPLHYILLKGWTSFFGCSEFSLRFLSAFCSALSLWIYYQISMMLFSKRVALLSVALLSLSRYHIDFAQEARCYAMMGCLVLLSMYFFIRMMQTLQWRFYVGYIVAAALMLYTHYYAIFVIIMQNLYIVTTVLLDRPIKWRQVGFWIAGQVVVGGLFLPWVSVLAQAVNKFSAVETILQRPGLIDVAACFDAFSGGKASATGLFLAIACLSVLDGRNRPLSVKVEPRKTAFEWPQNRTGSYCLLFYWLVIPMALPFLYSLYRVPVFSSRYTLISSYAFYMFISLGVFSVPLRWLRGVLIGAILLVSIRATVPRYFFHNNEQWRQVAGYIESRTEPEDALLFHAPFCGTVAYRFYAERDDLLVLGFPKGQAGSYAVTETDIASFRTLIEKHRRLWFILSHSRDQHGLILREIQKDYDQMDHCVFEKIEVWLFVKKQG